MSSTLTIETKENGEFSFHVADYGVVWITDGDGKKVNDHTRTELAFRTLFKLASEGQRSRASVGGN